MRPGRLDRILYVSPPDLEARKQIFRNSFAKMAVNDDVDIDELAELVRNPRHILHRRLKVTDVAFSRRPRAAPAQSAHRYVKMPLSRL